MDNINNKIAELMASDKFWQCIADELEKLTGESRLGGKHATDLAKQMFTALPKRAVADPHRQRTKTHGKSAKR